MDLLFKRYASPFVLLDSLILTSSCADFIDEFFNFVNEDKQWEFFLHKVYDETWGEFKDRIGEEHEEKQINLGATIIKSKNMLKNFTPE
jgi:hypothetical protein